MSKNKIDNVLGRRIIEPGGFYFGDDENKIYTLLGSCVAVTMWHPVRKIVGMCHVVLPSREKETTNTRFAGCAIEKFVEEIKGFNTVPREYEVKVYGGGNMFPSLVKDDNKLIGLKNIKEVERLLMKTGFHIKFKDVGGSVARKLTLNRLTGGITIEHVKVEI